MDATDLSSKGHLFVDWLLLNEFNVVVWDMDCTMSTGHCGPGLTVDQLDCYVASTSPDFVEAMDCIHNYNLSGDKSIKCAVATGSDPLEYDLPGQSRETHILGPDLATKIIQTHCPDTLSLFELMVGYDCRLHTAEQDARVNYEGKREHMRVIQRHYNVPFRNMVLIDDSPSSLVNEDGWTGIRVWGKDGFKFEHSCIDLRGSNLNIPHRGADELPAPES